MTSQTPEGGLQSVEEVRDQIWRSGNSFRSETERKDEIYHTIATDRHAIAEVLAREIEKMKGVYSAKDAIDQAIAIINKTLREE